MLGGSYYLTGQLTLSLCTPPILYEYILYRMYMYEGRLALVMLGGAYYLTGQVTLSLSKSVQSYINICYIVCICIEGAGAWHVGRGRPKKRSG